MNDNAESGTFFYVLQDALDILFVDDDPILREFAQVHLTTETAKVTVAEDGVSAMAALETTRPDIILLDLEMPRMDGFEVLQRLRAGGPHRRTPVIVVTGREDIAAVDRAYQEGATSFVVKPLNWRLLSYQIRYVHRTCYAERSLSAAGSRFLAEALRADPALKPAATTFLAVLEQAAGAGAPRGTGG